MASYDPVSFHSDKLEPQLYVALMSIFSGLTLHQMSWPMLSNHKLEFIHWMRHRLKMMSDLHAAKTSAGTAGLSIGGAVAWYLSMFYLRPELVWFIDVDESSSKLESHIPILSLSPSQKTSICISTLEDNSSRPLIPPQVIVLEDGVLNYNSKNKNISITSPRLCNQQRNEAMPIRWVSFDLYAIYRNNMRQMLWWSAFLVGSWLCGIRDFCTDRRHLRLQKVK